MNVELAVERGLAKPGHAPADRHAILRADNVIWCPTRLVFGAASPAIQLLAIRLA